MRVRYLQVRVEMNANKDLDLWSITGNGSRRVVGLVVGIHGRGLLA